MKEGYRLFTEQLPAVTKAYPSFCIIRADHFYLKGTLDIVDSNGKYWDTYNIEIRHCDNFPFHFPIVHETGGKIPRILDWHIKPHDGSCCITVPIKEVLYCKNGITIIQFIEDHVIPYFFNQTYRKTEGVYANGEYGHGVFGKIDFYVELFETDKMNELVNMLKKCIFLKGNLNKKSSCICGSKMRMRKCHQDIYQVTKTINIKMLNDDLQQIYALLKRVNNISSPTIPSQPHAPSATLPDHDNLA